MADGIRISSGMTVTVDGVELVRTPAKSVTVTMAGTRANAVVQDIGFAAHEAVAWPSDSGTEGWATFQNLDDTNYIQLGLDVSGTFYPFARLIAGEPPVQFNIDGVIYAKANTAACKLRAACAER